jgi:hypothetical protein
MDAYRLLQDTTRKNRRVDNIEVLADLREGDDRWSEMPAEHRRFQTAMRAVRMIESREIGMIVVVDVMITGGGTRLEIQVRVEFAAIFTRMGVKIRPIRQPDQKAGDAVAHNGDSTHVRNSVDAGQASQ